jgi:hypothetical protein
MRPCQNVLVHNSKNLFTGVCEPAVSQLVAELCYKPEGYEFDCRWGHGVFPLTKSIRRAVTLGDGRGDADNRAAIC